MSRNELPSCSIVNTQGRLDFNTVPTSDLLGNDKPNGDVAELVYTVAEGVPQASNDTVEQLSTGLGGGYVLPTSTLSHESLADSSASDFLNGPCT